MFHASKLCLTKSEMYSKAQDYVTTHLQTTDNTDVFTSTMVKASKKLSRLFWVRY